MDCVPAWHNRNWYLDFSHCGLSNDPKISLSPSASSRLCWDSQVIGEATVTTILVLIPTMYRLYYRLPICMCYIWVMSPSGPTILLQLLKYNIAYQWPILPTWIKSPASGLFTQPCDQMQIKENIKAPRHWPLWCEFTGEIPAQMASNAHARSHCFPRLRLGCVQILRLLVRP